MFRKRFSRISLSVAKYLPIRFLETAHMSQYGSKFVQCMLAVDIGLVQVRLIEANTNFI
jgi:hypothetical protein